MDTMEILKFKSYWNGENPLAILQLKTLCFGLVFVIFEPNWPTGFLCLSFWLLWWIPWSYEIIVAYATLYWCFLYINFFYFHWRFGFLVISLSLSLSLFGWDRLFVYLLKPVWIYLWCKQHNSVFENNALLFQNSWLFLYVWIVAMYITWVGMLGRKEALMPLVSMFEKFSSHVRSCSLNLITRVEIIVCLLCFS